MTKNLIFIIIFSLFISSCETNEDKKLFGQILGAAVGGYIGSKFGSGVGNQITTALGVAVGAVIASKIANILLEEDKESYGNAIIDSLEENSDNETDKWISPNDSNTSAEIKPLNLYEKDGEPCRDFEQVVVKNGERFVDKSTACRDESGNWKVT